MANDNSQKRDGRLLTHGSLITDYTLDIKENADGKLVLMNNIRSISNLNDIGSSILRKVDYRDTIPDVADATSAILLGYPGRTVVYTGVSTGEFQKGCAYICVPAPGYSWSPLTDGNSAGLIHCINGVSQSDGPIDGDYFLIVNESGNPRAIFFYDIVDNEVVVSMAVGVSTVAEAKQKERVTIYKYTNSTWMRTSEINEYLCGFNGCIVEHIDTRMANLFKGHVVSSSDPSPAFLWVLVSAQETLSASVYETVYPVDNKCVLAENPTCFYFGDISVITDELVITLDKSNIIPGEFCNTNVVYLSIHKPTNITFLGVAGDHEKTVHVIGNTFSSAGTYRCVVECIPDDTITVDVLQIDAFSSAGETVGTMYGLRYNLGSTSVTATRIELTRNVDSNGDIVETVKQLSSNESFISMPCHNFKRCVMKNFSSGIPEYYLNADNSLKKADGSFADLTGADGDVVVEIPRCYLRVTKPHAANTTETSGNIDYIISDRPIPDPPAGSVDLLIYNGVHPFFRVGGDLELDSHGRVQYEHSFDFATHQIVNTGMPLRSPKNKIYVGAFQSVRTHHGTMQSSPKTLKAIATGYGQNQFVDNTGKFSDKAKYPILSEGVAVGQTVTSTVRTGTIGDLTMAVENTNARSVAPYRNGELTYVGMPGLYVTITTGLVELPMLPDGCANASFCGDSELDYSYKLATTSRFQNGIDYYTKAGNVYTLAKVMVGDSIPANTYYVRYIAASLDVTYVWKSDSTTTFQIKYNSSTSKWELKCTWNNSGSVETVLIATGQSATSTPSDMSSVQWTPNSSVVDPSSIDSIIVEEGIHHLTIGPVNYGTRDDSFSWSNQASWDDAIAGNPNWALNYRPLTVPKKYDLHLMHGAHYSVDNGNVSYIYSHTKIKASLEDEATVFKIIDLPNGQTSCEFTFSSSLDPSAVTSVSGSNIWYGLDEHGVVNTNYALSFDPASVAWSYKDAKGNTLISDKWHYNEPDYMTVTQDAAAKYGKSYYVRGGVGPDFTYSKAQVTVGDSVDGLYELTGGPLPALCQYVDKDHRYLTAMDTGFRPRNSFNEYIPIENKELGLQIGTCECVVNKYADIHLIREYEHIEASEDFRLVFDNGSLRWIIKKYDSSVGHDVVLYQSERLDPAAFDWDRTSVCAGQTNQYTPVARQCFVNVDSGNINVYMVPELAPGGSSTVSMTEITQTSGSYPYKYRQWYAEANSAYYRLEYISEDNNIKPSGWSKSLGQLYGGEWAILKYDSAQSASQNPAVPMTVVASSMDLVIPLLKDGTSGTYEACLFQPINTQDRNQQRTFDIDTYNTTNTSLVYKLTLTKSGTSSRNILMFLIDENGNIPDYFTGTLLRYKLGRLLGSYTGRWVIVEFTDGTFTDIATSGTWQVYDADHPELNKPISWSEQIVKGGPWIPRLVFTSNPENDDLANNEAVIKLHNSVLMDMEVADKGFPHNTNYRFKEYLALMTAIEFGTFDITDALTKGKTGITSQSYAKETFSGRTCQFGNNTGAVVYDPDIDINISSSDFASSSSLDRIVAISYRGIENPFGNIGVYDDGMTPYIQNNEISGYFASTDDKSYTDILYGMAAYKNVITPSDPLMKPSCYKHCASLQYGWINYTCPTGTVHSFNKVNLLPTHVDGEVQKTGNGFGTAANGIISEMDYVNYGIPYYGPCTYHSAYLTYPSFFSLMYAQHLPGNVGGRLQY